MLCEHGSFSIIHDQASCGELIDSYQSQRDLFVFHLYCIISLILACDNNMSTLLQISVIITDVHCTVGLS